MSNIQAHPGLRLLSLGKAPVSHPNPPLLKDPSFTPSDGGGIRGLSELLILRQMMERIQFQRGLEELPLPCEYFDLIGGTSTGG